MNLIRYILLCLCTLLPAVSAVGGDTLHVRTQEAFDALPDALSAHLAPSAEGEVVVRFGPGTFYYREAHLDLSGVDTKARLTLSGSEGTILVAAGEEIGTGEQPEPPCTPDDLFVRTDTSVPQVWHRNGRVVQAAGFPHPVLFRKGLYRIRCSEPDLPEDAAKDVYVILTQWFIGAVFKVEKIQNRFLYFRKIRPVRTPLLSELRFGRCRPRYMLLFPPEKGHPVLHRCISSAFLSMEKGRLGALVLSGLRFAGNRNGAPLIRFRKAEGDSLVVRNCVFDGIRSPILVAKSTPDVAFRNNLVRKCYLGAVHCDYDSARSRVEDNTFLDSGLAFTNAPVVCCQGADFRIVRNYFEDFTYSAVGVGTHYTETAAPTASGEVRDNEICYSDTFRKEVRRTLIDAGAIYVWTQNKDVRILHNYIHDIAGFHGNRGILCDDGTVNVTIAGNLILAIRKSRCIDLRKHLDVERRKDSRIRRVNVGNKMYDNTVDGRCRFYVRRGDPTGFRGRNRVLKPGYDRAEVVRKWKEEGR